MGFLQPLFLWGIAGISIPVLIHLFSRRKSVPYYFSTLKFIKLTHRKTIRRQKLEEILVLVMRSVLIACLFMAAAQPVSRKTLFSEKESWVVLILDDSASMAASAESPWINLQKTSERILANMKKGTHVALIFTGGKIVPFSTICEEIARQIRDSKPGFHGNKIQPAVENAFYMLEKKIGYHRIFIITDMQKSAWENFSFVNSKKINPDITIIDVGNEEKQINLGIKDFYPIPGKNIHVCEIMNWSNEEITAEVKINGDGFEITRTFSAGEKKTAELEIPINRDCQNLKAEILYSDVMKSDNKFYMQKDTGGQKKVLLTGSDDVSIFYVKSSVESAGTISVDIKKINELHDTVFEKYRAILFVNPPRIESVIRQKIIEYASGGGTLIYFAGERIASEDFNSDWMIQAKNEFFMPAKVSGKNELLRPGRIAWIASGHPLFAEFGEKTLDFLKTSRFNACFSTKEITGDILMKLDNGYPVLCEKRAGKGKIFLFLFSPQQSWTNFQTKPFFPVMMSVMIEYLSGFTSSVSVGESVVVKGADNSDIIKIVNPEGEIRTINNREKIAVSYTPDIPGIWTAIFSNKEGEQKQMIAANVPYTEGNPLKISYGEVRSIFRKNRISFINRHRIEKIVEAEATGGQLTIFFLEISLIFLILELILSNLFIFLKEKGTRNV